MPELHLPFSTFHHVCLTLSSKTVTLHIDGQPAGSRPRKPDASPIGLDILTLGSRHYSNTATPPAADGFFHGRIAELLVYDHALTNPQRQAVHTHLAEKHQALTNPPEPSPNTLTLQILKRVENLPPIHFLVPGFSTREIPLDLPNINNLKYRSDGKLFASAYNGDVYLLSDTDDDGLEDHAHLWWDNQGRLRAPVGLDLTPPGYKYGDGIFIPSVGKVSLITDTDNDGTADKETVIATDWPPAKQSVDAVGVAYDHRDGSVYFGLGTAMYNNAYLLDDKGVAQFDLGGELGTVMRIAPDFSSREIVCTGVRFSVGMAFNHLGDLFVSEQEGATWMAHGNAFDELLHIQPDRHYGFPPRHPVHLPNVIDEPSTFDYGPQHQSLCGLLFNDPVKPGAPTFGPAWWRGDAFLVGESRGKLYRTKLTKTPHGYIAHNELVASIDGLATDAAFSPDGALALAAHSGKPDWGTGPQGRGKLYKTTYSGPAIPQPVITYQSAPNEIKVTYDRPVDPKTLTNLQKRTTIVSGQHVRAGDRYEPFHPGYKVINAQLAAPRYNVPVLAANLSPDHRTLSFETAPVTIPTHLALTIDAPQPTDLHTTTNGATATFTPAGATTPTWSGWLPHLDLSAARDIAPDQPVTDNPGTLDIRANLDLHHMLRPAVQPGETLDFNYPDEIVDLAFFSTTSPLTVTIDGETKSSTVGHTTHQVRFKRRAPSAAYLTSIAVQLHHPGGSTPPDLRLTYTTNEDARQRPLARRRILNPWVQTGISNTTTKPDLDPRLAGGDPGRGRALFFGDTAQCSRCHTAGDGGGTVGPDLSNLPHRDLDAVLRDITDPSAAINPDYVAYTVTTTAGETLAGILRDPGDGTPPPRPVRRHLDALPKIHPENRRPPPRLPHAPRPGQSPNKATTSRPANLPPTVAPGPPDPPPHQRPRPHFSCRACAPLAPLLQRPRRTSPPPKKPIRPKPISAFQLVSLSACQHFRTPIPSTHTPPPDPSPGSPPATPGANKTGTPAHSAPGTSTRASLPKPPAAPSQNHSPAPPDPRTGGAQTSPVPTPK